MGRRRAMMKSQQVVMSFKTNKNGTFNPSMTVTSGILKWIINGVEYVTNNPSVALTGETVDVIILSNGVTEGTGLLAAQFYSQNIIGMLDFSFFTLTNVLRTHSNPLLTGLSFRSTPQTIGPCELYSCNLTGNLDLSNLALTGGCLAYLNLNLTSISFKASGNTGQVRLNNCNLTSLDLSGWTITTLFYAYSNPNLTSITFSTNANTGAISVASTKLPALNLTNFRVNGLFEANNCTLLTSITFSSLANVCNTFTAASSALTSIDFTNVQHTGFIRLNGNVNLNSVVMGSITRGVPQLTIQNCAVSTSSVNALLSFLNTYFSANAPTQNLTFTANGGTNGSPTGGVNNVDLINLDTVVFPAAGYDFIYAIN